MNSYSIAITTPEVAALLLEMTVKTAVTGPNAANLAYLHDQARKAVDAVPPIAPSPTWSKKDG